MIVREQGDRLYLAVEDSDLEIETEDCSDQRYICANLNFGVLAIPRGGSPNRPCEEIRQLFRFCVVSEFPDGALRARVVRFGDGATVEIVYSVETGITDVISILPPPGLHSWSQIAPMKLTSERGIFAQPRNPQ